MRRGRTLADLDVGQSGVIREVNGEKAFHRRLLDMGFTPGTDVTLKRRAPLGDPLELSLRGYALTLRSDDARSVRLW